MTKDGHTQSRDAINELLMYWNKCCLSQESFTKKCQRSTHIMTERKCSYKAFVKRKSRSSTVNSSREHDMSKLYSLFESTNIFPIDPNVERKMTNIFFWDHVDCPKKVGSKKDFDKSNVEPSELDILIESNLCHSEGEREDYVKFEL